MSSLSARWIEFLRDEQGATAIEYGLVVALIAMPLIVWGTQIGEKLKVVLLTASDGLK